MVTGTAEEDLGHELDGLTSDGDVVEQGNRIGLGAICILQGFQPEVEVVGGDCIASERPGNTKCPKLPEGKAAEEVLDGDPDLRLPAHSASSRQCDF